MKHKLWHRAAFVLLGSVAIAACDDSTDPTPTASAMEAVTSTTITGAAGQQASISPTVRVLGPGGAPVAGAIVEFRVTSGLGSVEFGDVVTDANGVASAGVWTLGPHPGAQTVTATVEGAAPVVFTSNTGVGPIGKVAIIAGNNQLIDPSTAVPINPTVLVSDAFNAPIANASVTFTVLTGGGTIAGGTSTTVTTNASGQASAGPWVLGAVPGPNTLRAQAGAVQVTFSATAEGPCDRQPVVTIGTPTDGSLGVDDCVIDGVPRKNFRLNVTAGQAVLIEVSSAAFNTFLNVSTPLGVPIARDDDSGTGTNSVLRLIPATTGTVVIGAGATAGGATGAFTVTVTTTNTAITDCIPPNFVQVGVANIAQVLADTDCTIAGTTPFYGAPYDGSGPYPGDEVQIYLTTGQQVRVRMEPTGVAVGDMDALIVVFNSANVRTFRDGAFLAPEEFVYTATATGFHRIIFTSFGLTTNVPDPWMFGPYNASITAP